MRTKNLKINGFVSELSASKVKPPSVSKGWVRIKHARVWNLLRKIETKGSVVEKERVERGSAWKERDRLG